MLNVISHQGKANQNHEMLLHIHQGGNNEEDRQ